MWIARVRVDITPADGEVIIATAQGPLNYPGSWRSFNVYSRVGSNQESGYFPPMVCFYHSLPGVQIASRNALEAASVEVYVDLAAYVPK